MDYTDPPGMPDDERMTAAELRCVREWLGLTGEWLASYLDVKDRTVRRWEAGTSPIPDGVRLKIEDLEQETATAAGALMRALARGRPDPIVVVYRTDAEYHAVAGGVMPASWHRMVVMRAVSQVPWVSITFPAEAVAA